MKRNARLAAAMLTSALVLGLGGCAAPDFNRSLYSLNQPVVERTHYTLDMATSPGGPSIPEQRRLAGWAGTRLEWALRTPALIAPGGRSWTLSFWDQSVWLCGVF